MTAFTAADAASAVDGRLVGDGSLRLSGLATLEAAGPEDLSFLHRADYREVAARSAAGCVIVPDPAWLPGRCLIVVSDPQRALVAALEAFHETDSPEPGVADGAHVDDSADIARGASVAPGAVVAAGARVGERSIVGPSAVVGEGVAIGADCRIGAGAVLLPGTRIGDRVILHANAVLGADGFGYVSGADGHLKIPHVGGVVLEDDVEIGAGACIDRGLLGDTRIGRGTKVDNLVQVAHNVDVGERCLLVAQSGVAGSTRLGDGAILAGQAGAAGHLSIGAGARIAAASAALQDVEAGASVAGVPAGDLASWRRQVAAIRRLPEALRRLARLERRMPRGDDDE